jgi:hypothetical protein
VLLQEAAKDAELLLSNTFLADLRAPDTSNTLRPLHQLLINDAPWILARVKTGDVLHIGSIYVPSYYYIRVLILLIYYMCPHTAMCVCSYCSI